jgi:hypothetical protein
MTNDHASVFARIDAALQRIEAVASNARPTTSPANDADPEGAESRYQRLRERTRAALGELDAVIARTSREARR